MVIAYALAGTLDFNPLTDSIDGVQLDPPVGEDLPALGFDPGESGFLAAPDDRSGIDIAVSPTSDRLQLLQPFPAWDGNDYIDLPVLMKAKGKCTTDHISAAGPWLKYRGHLENISGNLFLGVINAFTGAAGEGKDPLDGETRSFPDIAKHLAESGVRWCAVGDENYGEGSSREHAAMEPRYRGGLVIFARSFARIHETNLKKQGLLPLTFADPATYDLIGEDDRISVLGLADRWHRTSRCSAGSPSPTARPSTSSACTRSAPSRSSGSRPAARSTSSARSSSAKDTRRTTCRSGSATSVRGRNLVRATSCSRTRRCSGCRTTARSWVGGWARCARRTAGGAGAGQRDHPSHAIAAEVAAEMLDDPPPDAVAQNVLRPEAYAVLLDELGCVDQHVRLQVYAHHLDSTADVARRRGGGHPGVGAAGRGGGGVLWPLPAPPYGRE